MKFIMKHNGINWSVSNNGKLLGHREDRAVPVYEFWIGNPPALDDPNHSLFVAILDFAAAKGIVRKLHVYTVT
jgi:hypothetical protein